MYNEEYFLPALNDGTDMTAAIEQKLMSYGVCMLGDGDYVVHGVDMPDGSSLIGVGCRSRLLLREDINEGYTVRLRSFCTVKNLFVVGALEDITLPDAVGQRHGLAFIGDAQPKVRSAQAHNSMISGCFISGFTGGGITCTDTGYKTHCAMTVSDCHIYNCGAGINISHFSEYHMFTNIMCNRCLYGCINNGGNNVFVNCGFDSNVTGFLIDNAHGQSINNSHGSAVGCTFNHTDGNGGIGIHILGAQHGYSFTGCQIFYSQIVLADANDIVFSTLNAGRQVEISVTGGGLTMFNGCAFSVMPDAIRVTDNPHVKFINCYTKHGDAVGI